MAFAPRTRPDRYTILEHLAMTPDEIRRQAGTSMSTPSPSAEPGGRQHAASGPPVADFYGVNRGAGCSARRSASGSAPGSRSSRTSTGWRPTVLTVANLGARLPGRLGHVAARAPAPRPAGSWAWPVGLLALLGWQFAYALDCADGQLARVTGQTSPAGARVDVLCDVAAQIALVAALAAVAEAQVPETPALAARRLRRHLDGQPGHLGDAVRPAGREHGHLDARCRCGWSSWSATTAR